MDQAARASVRVEQVCVRLSTRHLASALQLAHAALPLFSIAVCYHAFFFGSFYLLFAVALVFKLSWCPALSRPLPSLPQYMSAQDTPGSPVRVLCQGAHAARATARARAD